MTFRMRFGVGALAILLSAALTAAALAQPRPPAGGPPKQPEHVSLKGAIDLVVPGQGIQITAADGQVWRLGLKNAKLRVVGTAKADFLRPGLYVRFAALANKNQGKLKDDNVAKMTLVTLSQEFSPGAHPDPTGKSDDENFNAYDIIGQIISIKGNALNLSVRGFNPKLHIDITDATEIDFNFADLSVVKQGDTLEGHGVKVDLPQMPQRGGPQGRPGMGGRMMGPGMPGQMPPGMAGRPAPKLPPGVTPGLGGGFQGPGAAPGGQAGAGGQPAAGGQPPAGGQPAAGGQPPAAGGATNPPGWGGEKLPSYCNLTEGKITKAEPLSGGAAVKGRGSSRSSARKEKSEGSDAPAGFGFDKPKRGSKKDAEK